ncbi:TraB/GumN family protein [Xenophilus arseniciresistens]|uniref:TraB/GumN family protein n=1 Tax=Xenophilus arseniciresistens TaxID=1283306 RepID=A0AAE3N7C5_9BURK|nr:TraB/GumN family protein [Xenophilus arseniciresistens]MDA7417345.1 TraB/GumN family protein [Xenophilus arseniciresistens]
MSRILFGHASSHAWQSAAASLPAPRVSTSARRMLTPVSRRREMLLALALAPWLKALATPAETPPQAGEGGLLYRAVRGESTVFLYGTIHVGSASFYPLSPRVLRPLRRAEVLVVEVDLLAPDLASAFRQHGTLPADAPSLSIAEADAQRIDPMLRAAQIDPAFARRFKPEVLAMTLVGLAAAPLGLSTAYGVDYFLLGFARAAGIPVVELEGFAMQMTMNDTLPEAQRQAMLSEALEDLASGHSTRVVSRVVRGWQEHDLSLLDPEADPSRSPELHKIFVKQMAERNEAMAQRIGALSGGQYQRLFVAVGALHLVGPQALPALLERQGYRVARLM